MNFLKKLENFATDKSSSGSMQHWCITAERAEGLKDKDRFSKSDPYLKIEFGGKHFNTRVIKNDRSPYWNETFDFHVGSQHANSINLTLKDSDIGFDDTIGTAVVARSDLPSLSGEEKYLKIPLYSKDQVTGIVHLRVKQIPDGQLQSSQQQSSQQSYQNTSSYPQQQQMPQQQYSGFQQSSSYSQQQPPPSNNYNQQPSFNQPSYNQPPSYNPNQSQPYDQSQYGQRQGPPNQNYQQQQQPYNSNYGNRM